MANGKREKRRLLQEEIDWGRELAAYLEVPLDGLDAEDAEAEQEMAEADSWREDILAALQALIPEGAQHHQLVPHSIPADLEDLIAQARDLRDRIRAAGLAALEALEAQAERIGPALEAVRERVAARQAERTRLLEAAAAVATPDQADEGEQQELAALRQAVEDELPPLAVTEGELELARTALQALEARRAEIAQAVAARLETHARIAREFGDVDQAGYLPDQTALLAAKRIAVEQALEPPVTEARNTAAQQALDALREAAETVRAELEGLGGQEGIEDLCAAAGINADDYAALETALGGRKAVANLRKVFSAAELGGLSAALGAGEFVTLLASAGGAAKLKEAMDGLGDKAHLKTLAAGGLSGKDIAGLCGDLGGSFVAALLADGAKPADITALQTALGADAAQVAKLAKASGLDNSPKALLAVYQTGCGGDAGKFKDFCNGFGDDTSQKQLKGLIKEGGLGAAPEALAQLYLNGGGLEAVQQLGKSFDSADARAGLKRALAKGGLAGQSGVKDEGDISTDCLTALLQHGSGAKPDGMSGADDLKRRADGLAAMFKDMDETACSNLKTMMSKGGLGTEPEILAHLAGEGCNGDGSKLAALGAEIAKGDTAKRLKDAVEKGGLASADGASTKCLARLLSPGSDGNPAELANLLNALDSGPKLANLKGVMTTGGLGQHPDVLGDLYRNGCLAAPDGAADGSGAKNPQVLVDMIGEFSGADAAKFNELMTAGGFDGWDAAKGVSRLGSVMRYGFAPKGGAQDGKKLRQLYDAFKTGGNHMAALDTTMTALEDADDWVLEQSQKNAPNQPGKGLRNVMFAGSRAGNPADLHSTFYTKLNTRAAAAQTGTVPKLTLEGLIQTAASFEHEPVPAGSDSLELTLGGGEKAHLRLDHVLDRHTRKYQIVQGKKTTLYPRQVDQAQIEELAVNTLDGFPGVPPYVREFADGVLGPDPSPNRPPGKPPPGPKRNPPVDVHDLRGDYVFFDNVAGSYDDADGTQNATSKIGFNPDPTDGTGERAFVGQLFPRTGTNLLTVHKNDMREIKRALTV